MGSCCIQVHDSVSYSCTCVYITVNTPAASIQWVSEWTCCFKEVSQGRLQVSSAWLYLSRIQGAPEAATHASEKAWNEMKVATPCAHAILVMQLSCITHSSREPCILTWYFDFVTLFRHDLAFHGLYYYHHCMPYVVGWCLSGRPPDLVLSCTAHVTAHCVLGKFGKQAGCMVYVPALCLVIHSWQLFEVCHPVWFESDGGIGYLFH
jgi:hypothetical protein